MSNSIPADNDSSHSILSTNTLSDTRTEHAGNDAGSADVSMDATSYSVEDMVTLLTDMASEIVERQDIQEITIVEDTKEDAQTIDSVHKAEETAQEQPVAAILLPKPEKPILPMMPLFDPQEKSRRRFTRHWILSIALLVLLLGAILTPLIVVTSYGVHAYATYNLLRAHAYGGMQHLLSIKTLFTGASKNPTSVFDVSKLTSAKKEMVAAQDDFTQVELLVDHTSLIQTIAQYLPQYRPQVISVRAASQIGIDATQIGNQLISMALKLGPRLQGPLLSASHAPLVTADDLTMIGQTITTILPHITDIQVQASQLSLQALPISTSQRTQIQQLLQLLPQVETLLLHGRDLLGPFSWLLGVDAARTFLVQTMDRGELRPTGGFTGQYGELSLNSGRVGPFSLHDISSVEYSDNSPTIGQLAPLAYRSWWPFANWGLRDSNLSADFPTSARIAIKEYKHEVGGNVDGVILFTPFFIEHILQAIGPIQITKYQETITAENLEERLHYYQLDNAGIRKIEIIEHTTNGTDVRKMFTSEVARVLMDRVRHASPGELLALGLQVMNDLKTKDLQIYMTNPQVESLLEQYGYAAEMDRSNTHDGLFIVQTNVSASKASQYVQTMVHDTVRLDVTGGATHSLEMQLIYNQIGPVYGLDTYRDYIRFYVPQSARLLSGNGFDTGVALCGGPLAACPSDGVYPHQELVCPPGLYNAGASATMLDDPYQGNWHPLDVIGPPTNTTSDESGRAMFGGYVVIPKNCSLTVTLSWYVPPTGTGNYDLLVQRQVSTFPTFNLTVIPDANACPVNNAAEQQLNTTLTTDTSFVLSDTRGPHDKVAPCVLKIL